MMGTEHIAEALAPVFADLRRRAEVADSFIDRDLYRLSLATLWSNLVLDPDGSGIEEAELESVHDVISTECAATLGDGASLTDVFRWIASTPGDKAMAAAHLRPEHADMLRYFASMILDPDGHREWMDEIRDEQLR